MINLATDCKFGCNMAVVWLWALTCDPWGGPAFWTPCRRRHTGRAARPCASSRESAGCSSWWSGADSTGRWTASWAGQLGRGRRAVVGPAADPDPTTDPAADPAPAGRTEAAPAAAEAAAAPAPWQTRPDARSRTCWRSCWRPTLPQPLRPCRRRRAGSESGVTPAERGTTRARSVRAAGRPWRRRRRLTSSGALREGRAADRSRPMRGQTGAGCLARTVAAAAATAAAAPGLRPRPHRDADWPR